MTNNARPINSWLEATVSAAAELCQTTLGTELVIAEHGVPLGAEVMGCFVSIFDDTGSVEVGMAADPAGCQTLAQSLFASDEPLSDADVTDALGEIANMLAGGVKKRLQIENTPMQLGLPIVMDGRIRPTDRQDLVCSNVQLGDVVAQLVIVSSKD
jgi:CheY-specific phosphatase CheX